METANFTIKCIRNTCTAMVERQGLRKIKRIFSIEPFFIIVHKSVGKKITIKVLAHGDLHNLIAKERLIHDGSGRMFVDPNNIQCCEVCTHLHSHTSTTYTGFSLRSVVFTDTQR